MKKILIMMALALATGTAFAIFCFFDYFLFTLQSHMV